MQEPFTIQDVLDLTKKVNCKYRTSTINTGNWKDSIK